MAEQATTARGGASGAYHVGRFEGRVFEIPALYARHAAGYTQAVLVDRMHGSVHTELTLNELAPSGYIGAHAHAYEESFYVLEGEAVVAIGDHAHRLRRGDYGTVKFGTIHAWRSEDAAPVRWLQMASPQPKADGVDTALVADRPVPADSPPLDPGARTPLLGHFDVAQIPAREKRTGAGRGLEGVYLNWLVDAEFGARHHRMALIEYPPGVGIGAHDHAFEESYFFLSGEVDAILDGTPFRVRAGDVVWTGVGCMHSFRNTSAAPVRWIETFSPQPPAENAFRFIADWERRVRALGTNSKTN